MTLKKLSDCYFKKKWGNLYLVTNGDTELFIMNVDTFEKRNLNFKSSRLEIQNGIIYSEKNYSSTVFDLNNLSLIEFNKSRYKIGSSYSMKLIPFGHYRDNKFLAKFYNKCKKCIYTHDTPDIWIFERSTPNILYTDITKNSLSMLNLRDLNHRWNIDLNFEVFNDQEIKFKINHQAILKFDEELVFVAGNIPLDERRSKYYKLISLNIETGKILWIENYEISDLVKFENKFLYKNEAKIIQRNPRVQNEIIEYDFTDLVKTSKVFTDEIFYWHSASDFFWNDEKVIFYSSRKLLFCMIDVKSKRIEFEFQFEIGVHVKMDVISMRKPEYHDRKIIVNVDSTMFVFSDFE